MAQGYCVTVTPTIMDGAVVRWYKSESAMEFGDESISASRNGVVGGRGAYLTPDLFESAWKAHVDIAMERSVTHLATHRTKTLFGREYVPVKAS